MTSLWPALNIRELDFHSQGKADSVSVPGWYAGCPTGNGEKQSCLQAEQSQANNSAVAYIPSISCGASCARAWYKCNLSNPLWPLKKPLWKMNTATRPHGQWQLIVGVAGGWGVLIDIFRTLHLADAFFLCHTSNCCSSSIGNWVFRFCLFCIWWLVIRPNHKEKSK